MGRAKAPYKRMSRMYAGGYGHPGHPYGGPGFIHPEEVSKIQAAEMEAEKKAFEEGKKYHESQVAAAQKAHEDGAKAWEAHMAAEKKAYEEHLTAHEKAAKEHHVAHEEMMCKQMEMMEKQNSAAYTGGQMPGYSYPGCPGYGYPATSHATPGYGNPATSYGYPGYGYQHQTAASSSCTPATAFPNSPYSRGCTSYY